MGTDIHLIAETRPDPDEPWQIVPGPVIECWSCKGLGITTRENYPNAADDQVGKPCYWCARAQYEDGTPMRGHVEPGRHRDEWYSDRNYVVFGVLADVRNGSGFAGCDLGDPVPVIAAPRGLPDDLSDAGKAWMADFGGDHTDTWLDLEEIMRYDWQRIIVKRGVLDLAAWAEYREHGIPKSWSGSIEGGIVRHVDHATMDAKLAESALVTDGWARRVTPDGLTYCTRLQWQQPLIDFARPFVERMKMLAMECGEQPTRLVFNFDS